jgi:hypothetical protein
MDVAGDLIASLQDCCQGSVVPLTADFPTKAGLDL